MLVETTPQLLGKRYRTEDQLGHGGMGAVFRAVDRLTGQPVALKRVLVAADQLILATQADDSTDFRIALAHEFKTLASLRHPNIISVLDYGFDDDLQPFFTMDLLTNAQTILTAGRSQPLKTQVDLVSQMLQALAYLHRRGIRHRDLKPANVLVEDGQVKVLDFGLAVTHEQSSATTSGTIAYMAPETLITFASDERADLYAVGVIAYEILTDKFPYNMNSITTLIEDIKHTIPNFQLLHDADPAVALVIERLLSKNPVDRYNDAGEVIAALAQATGLPLSYDSAATRESFLQAAQFVGRDEEFSRLVTVLNDAKAGQGASWLVGGESGIGKSRLLNELRTRALVDGVLVLRGQAVSEGALPYHIWRESLRWLVLVHDLTDFEAGVLKPIIPDIGELLQRADSGADNMVDNITVPELDPQAAQDRLLSVIEGLFRRQTVPTLIILEDLHWCGSESLALLSRINRVAPEMPLLLLGSYRNDERPDLPGILKDMQLLKLARLSQESISELSVSMLGSVGRRAEVLDLLNRETEGNVFFLVEVVRTLAEEAGQLGNIGSITLPERVFAGGIASVIQRRLSQVPEDAQELLRIAALAGRRINVELLKSIQSPTNLEQWLTICSDAAVLDVENGQWQFVHDKLREGIITQLTPDRKRDLHQTIAHAYETVYADSDEYSATLAYHWSQAGNTDKEGYYAAKAGQVALNSGAYTEAITFLNRAVELRKNAPAVERASHHRQLGRAYLNLGQLATSGEHYRQALLTLGRPDPFKSTPLAMDLLRQVGVQAGNRLLGVQSTGVDRDVLTETGLIYEQMGEWALLSNKTSLLIYCLLVNLNVMERLGPSTDLARAYSVACVAAGIIPLHSLARVYYRRAEELLPSEQDTLGLALILSRLNLYSNAIGDLDRAIEQGNRSAQLALLAGARDLAETAMVGESVAHYWRGNYKRSLEIYQQIATTALKSNDKLHQVWSLGGQSAVALHLDNLDDCIRFGEASLALLMESPEPNSMINRYGILSTAYLRNGDVTRALDYAGKALAVIDKMGRPTIANSLEGYVQAAETYFAVWTGDVEVNGVNKEDTAKSVERILRHLCAFGKLFAPGVPAASRFEGLYHWHKGQQDKALQAWQKSIAEAKRLAMVHEQALAHYEICRHLGTDNPEHRPHLEQAYILLKPLGAVYDLRKVAALE